MIWRCHISNLKQCANNPFRSSSCGGQKFCRGQPGGQDPSNRCLPLSLCPIARVFIIHYHRSRNRFLVRFGCLVPIQVPSCSVAPVSFGFGSAHPTKFSIQELQNQIFLDFFQGDLRRSRDAAGVRWRAAANAGGLRAVPFRHQRRRRRRRYHRHPPAWSDICSPSYFELFYSSWIALGISMKTNSNSVGSNS